MKPNWTLGASCVLALLASCAPPSPDRVSLADLGATWHVGVEGRDAVDAQVPGFVLEDLVRAGLAPDPYTGTHELDVQWVEDSTWTYTASFVRPDGWATSDSATLEFQGLNVFAAVEVNDAPVLDADNAHRTWTTAPFQLLDTNRLRVTFLPTAQEGQRRLDAFGMALPASNEAKPLGNKSALLCANPVTNSGGIGDHGLPDPAFTGTWCCNGMTRQRVQCSSLG